MKAIHKDIQDFLSQLGLTPTEILLYLTGLQYGPQTTSTYAKRSGVKRTTAQSALSSLVEKGMMGSHAQSGTTYYTASDPNLIQRHFDEQIDELKNKQLDLFNLLPLLEDISNQSVTSTEVSHYHGMDGVKTAIDAALYCASRKWKILAPEKNFFSEGDKEYADYFINTRRKRGIKAQSLWEPGFAAKRPYHPTDLAFRKPRLLPKELAGRFKTSIIIFDSSVLFVNSYRELSAVLIRSTEINQTMEIFFDGIWANAKEISPKKIKIPDSKL